MKEFLIVILLILISLLPLALFGRRVLRWLRRDNLVAELTEETIRLSDLAGGLKQSLASAESERLETEGWSNQAITENERLGKQIDALEDRITELQSASRTDHATIGDLHDQIKKLKRDLASERQRVTKLRKAPEFKPKKYSVVLDGKVIGKGIEAEVKIPAKVKAPTRKRGAK